MKGDGEHIKRLHEHKQIEKQLLPVWLHSVRFLLKRFKQELIGSSFLHSHFGFYDTNEDVVEMRNQEVSDQFYKQFKFL